MVKLAMKQPELFAGIYIRDVDAPASEKFALYQEKTPLRKALKRLLKNDCEMTLDKLAQR